MGYDRLGEDNTFRVGRLLEDLKADVAALQVFARRENDSYADDRLI